MVSHHLNNNMIEAEMALNKIEEIKSEIMFRKKKGLENNQIENVFITLIVITKKRVSTHNRIITLYQCFS